MHPKFPHVFEPITIRGKTYKNRLVAAPTMFAHSIFTIPPMKENVYRMVEYRARGGFGCVSTGEHPVNAEEGTALFYEHHMDFTKFEGPDFEAMKEYADRIKKHGAICYFEFCHEGARAEHNPPYSPWGPDGYVREDGVEVKELNTEMMEKICNDFYNISRFAKECGFDGILVHGGHGFIMQQFVSPWTNHRTDEFGGSMANRTRFPKMIIDACRRGIGEDGIIELRFSAEDGEPGGMTIDDTVEFCKEIDGLVDIIHVSNGLKWAGSRTHTFSSFLDPHGINVEHAAKIKAAVKVSKVAVVGGFNSPEHCEEVLAAGKVDFVELARQGFADPEFPNKALNGQEDHIRRCVRCFGCYPGFCEHPTDIPLFVKLGPEEAGKIYSPFAMGQCALNPNSGFGWYADRMPLPEGSRKVLIAGGGPGGLQAAITCAERGHKAVLVEKTGKLGGTMNFTDKDEDKIDLRNFKELLVREACESGADIRLNTVVTKELIDEVKPDAIIVAVGGHLVAPEIEGVENAVDVMAAYYDLDKVGQKVVMVGSGLTACEVALHLASHGRDVTVLCRRDMMAYETFGYYRNTLLEHMDDRGIHQMLSTKTLSIAKDGVTVEKDGETFVVPADTVFYSTGIRPNADAVEAVKALAGEIPVKVIGDANKSGKMGDAVRGGYMAVMEIL